MKNSIILMAFGLFIILISMLFIPHHIKYVYTEAEIIDVERVENNECIPTYEYEVNKKIYQGKINIPFECEDFQIGSKKTISYNPKNPELFDVGSKKEEIYIFIIGIIMFAFGFTSIRDYYKATKGIIQIARNPDNIENFVEELKNEANENNSSKE